MIQVMIVDDHKMIREGLKKLIEFDAEIKVIEQAKDGNDCLSKLEFSTPDVILLDINMPERDGIETLKIIKERKKYPKVLVLTVHNEVEYLIYLSGREVYTAQHDSPIKLKIDCQRYRSTKNRFTLRTRT